MADRQATLHISAELHNLAAIRCFVEDNAIAFNADQTAADELVCAVDECATNIIVHGYRGQPGTIEIEMKRDDAALIVYLRDHAPLFDPTGRPSPDLSQPLEGRPPGGFGIYLTRQSVDNMLYRVMAKGGNELILIKQLRSKLNLSNYLPGDNP
jgi:serine/threonine-protein kinase RsbW